MGRYIFTIGAAWILSACTIFPTQELTAYTDAFDQAMVETEKLIIETQMIRKAKSEEEAASAPAPVDTGFGFPIALTLASSDPDSRLGAIDQRREALSVVQEYNTALKMLAEGKTETEISSSITGLKQGIQGVAELVGIGADAIPGGDAVVGLASRVVLELERAQNRAQFKTALVNGAPLIRTYLDLLRSDAAAIYQYRAAAAIKKMSAAKREIRMSLFSLQALLSGTSGDEKKAIDNWTKSIDALLAKAELGAVPAGLKAGVSPGTPFDSVVSTQMDQSIHQMQDLAQTYAATRAAQLAYLDMIQSYGSLINAVENALATLRSATVTPADTNKQARALLLFAFDVKKSWTAVREARDAAS